jgi:hypothetical protein
MAIKLAVGLRNTIVDNMISNWGGTSAVLRLYTGTVPASADTAPTGTLLVEVTMTSGWNAAATGVATLVAGNTSIGVAVATGTAGYAALGDSAGTFRVYGSIGTTGTDFIVSAVAITTGATITCTQCTITQPAT